MNLADKIEGLAKAATKGDLSTAERHEINEYVECPFCQGDGEVGATDYCNFDDVALGVQFYGIGSEFGAHEKLWSTLVNNLPAILQALRAQEPPADVANQLSIHATAIRDTVEGYKPGAKVRFGAALIDCAEALERAATTITAQAAEIARLRDILEAIVAMQALRYGDATRTHMALIGLCVTAREVLKGNEP